MKSLIILALQSAFAIQPTVPVVNFAFWNNSGFVAQNNCYNYSTNRATNSYAQPGEASGISLWDLQCPEVTAAASADQGLTPTSFFPYTQKQDESLIALVVWPNNDYHWYRRGDDGMWTHKMGYLPASPVDHQGHLISSPETAERGNYTEFCGYFKIKNYILQPHEQNGGLVRIGNMQNLPEEPAHSEVVILKYSGRRNPHLPLKDYLGDMNFKNQLLSLSRQMGGARLATSAQISQLSKLGYNGILIIDREGLIFSKGSRVQVLGTEALGYDRGAHNPVHLALPQPMSIERGFAPN